MSILGILTLKLKNTLKYRHNLIFLIALPVLAAAGAWALLTFYLEGGASIPIGIIDYDKSNFSEIAVSRLAKNNTVGIRELQPGDDAGHLIQKGSLEAAIVIKPGFQDSITRGEPQGIFSVISTPDGIARGLAAELFSAQVSRLYFNSDSANRVVRDAENAAASAGRPPLTESEKKDIYDEAFDYCDSYWEPEPLMAIKYESLDETLSGSQANGQTGDDAPPTSGRPGEESDAGRQPGGGQDAAGRRFSLAPGSSGGWQDMRDMLNTLLSRAVFAIFFTFTAFCILNAAGIMTTEREDGILTRMRVNGFGYGAWIAVSAAAPFILYGIPCSVLLALLIKNTGGAIFAFAALLIISTLGPLAAYILKRPGAYKIFTLICVVISTVVSLYAF